MSLPIVYIADVPHVRRSLGFTARRGTIYVREAAVGPSPSPGLVRVTGTVSRYIHRVCYYREDLYDIEPELQDHPDVRLSQPGWLGRLFGEAPRPSLMGGRYKVEDVQVSLCLHPSLISYPEHSK